MLISKILGLLLAAGPHPTAATSPLDNIAREVSRVESIRHIKNVQKQISHLAQFGRWNSISQFFSSNSTFIWGNATVHGPSFIEEWLRTDSGAMDGIRPGSLNTLIAENPVISLNEDGKTARGRWNGIWFQGDGKGRTRIQGGIYENQYVQTDAGWRISLLRYYAMYEGTHEDGWKNVGGKAIPIVPYHFTTDSSGLPIPPAKGKAPFYNGTIARLEARIQKLNDEDNLRNLMHAHGYYVDRRMWTEVLDFHTENTTVSFNQTLYLGKPGLRRLLENMGPEGMTQGVNNDHPIFDLIIDVDANGREAIVRLIEVAMMGSANTHAASWKFNVYRNRFVKDRGVWKIQDGEITPLIEADYYKGWGGGGQKLPNKFVPPFVNVTGALLELDASSFRGSVNATLQNLRRRLRRSAAYDGSENQSHAYGYFLDGLQAVKVGKLFAKKGHEASPSAGFYQTPERITQANLTSYGTNRTALGSSISFYCRIQPVILVSEDGRSATVRTRLLQASTSITQAGCFNSAMYHDQVVLEDGKWRLWSVTIDEFYWQSSSWKDGWANAQLRNGTAPNPQPAGWTKRYPPDLTLADVGERESTFRGGSGHFVEWPEIQRMWFQYRNPISGRKPEWYWPGCVPRQARKDWSLEANGYQEPSTGP
jgi:hypothetical protein